MNTDFNVLLNQDEDMPFYLMPSNSSFAYM